MGTRKRNKLHSDMIQTYMRSKRQWTVEALPTMSAHEWSQLEAWWAGFRFDRTRHTEARRDAATAGGNAALIRHRQKVIPPNVTGGNLNVWMRYLAWQLERENAILRYRDGNDQQEEC
jgi:hypothetical protein